MKLSASILKEIVSTKVSVPNAHLLTLPEKVMQFGTGILLRGLPDYFIDKANRSGIFEGRIVMVKSTDRGSGDAFGSQDGLYTLCIRGISQGKPVSDNLIQSAVSRVLSASAEWEEVLKCACNPDIRVVISNTTEVGISLVKESVEAEPPQSYPAKLLACLWARFSALGGAHGTGWVIIPTELIPDNGHLLKEIVFELARFNQLPEDFMKWLDRETHFCNSLVDRIVTGMPDEDTRSKIEQEIGYQDDLLTVCEVYRLWAIEGTLEIQKILSFAGVDPGLVIASDIELFRELKLRVLNGTHTLSCGLAFLAGIETVRDATRDPYMGRFMEQLMFQEIGPSIPYPVEKEMLTNYMEEVMDRFRNPHLRHEWIKITLNYTSKIKMRCVPLLLKYYQDHGNYPRFFTLGFAGYLFFMKSVKTKETHYYGVFREKEYLIDDKMADSFHSWWQSGPPENWAKEMLADKNLWGADLSVLPGFEMAITGYLRSMAEVGVAETLKELMTKNNNP
ncbi:MAG: tagaturonate reductase [Bacteroidota bacterium]|nr:tagaturonate reductase [Bacteroidota bacterium]